MVFKGTGSLLLVFGYFWVLFSLLNGMITKADNFRYPKREDKKLGTIYNLKRSKECCVIKN